MTLSIHHVAVICSDLSAAKHFYVSVLGFRILRETYRETRDSWKIDLDIDGKSQIELFTFPHSPARSTNPESLGLRHLAFAVDHLEPVIERLTHAGIVFEPIRLDELTNKRFFFTKDPDGLPIEFYESA